VIKED
jgi:hypothetical protein